MFVLTLASLVMVSACSSSGSTQVPEPGPGEVGGLPTWGKGLCAHGVLGANSGDVEHVVLSDRKPFPTVSVMAPGGDLIASLPKNAAMTQASTTLHTGATGLCPWTYLHGKTRKVHLTAVRPGRYMVSAHVGSTLYAARVTVN